FHQWLQSRSVNRHSDREDDRRFERCGVRLQQASSIPGWSLESLPEILDARILHRVPARKTGEIAQRRWSYARRLSSDLLTYPDYLAEILALARLRVRAMRAHRA